MVKNYVIDTNVMIHDPKFMHKFGDNNIIIPLLCVEELDKLKSREGMVGFSARHVAKEIKYLMTKGDIHEGISLDNGGTLKVELNHMDMSVLPNGADLSKNDSKIIAVVMNLQKILVEPTILVSKDLYMMIKAASLGIPVEDYQNDKVVKGEVYTGYAEVMWPSAVIDDIYQQGYRLTESMRADLAATGIELYPNRFFHIKSSDQQGHEVIARYDGQKCVPLKYANDVAWGLTPINREQKMAFELLMDPDIHFTTIIGGAGSGKTILATATALQNVIEMGRYRKIVFVRPVVAAGQDIGFLPGDEKEKLRPWMGSFYDAIENLTDLKEIYKDKERGKNKGQDYHTYKKPEFTVEEFIEQFRQRGMIEMKTFTYMRGRTFTNALVIVDEAQEITPHIAKLMLTRAGKESKFVFLGDPSDNQIDNHYVDSRSNGLIYTLEKMKQFDITGHVTLQRVERSPLAEIAEQGM